MVKLRTTLGKFGEFWALIANFLLAWVRRNDFVNTNFSKLSKELADPKYGVSKYHTYSNINVGCYPLVRPLLTPF